MSSQTHLEKTRFITRTLLVHDHLRKVLVKEITLYPVITVSPTASPREAIDLIKACVLPLGDKF